MSEYPFRMQKPEKKKFQNLPTFFFLNTRFRTTYKQPNYKKLRCQK